MHAAAFSCQCSMAKKLSMTHHIYMTRHINLYIHAFYIAVKSIYYNVETEKLFVSLVDYPHKIL